MSKYKIITVLLLALLVSIFINQTVFAAFSGNPLQQACTDSGDAQGKNAACTQAAGQGTTDPIVGSSGIITTAVNLIAIIAGIGAVVMVILSGIRYITSGGDSQKAASARSGIISGLVGVAVVGLAWLIVSMVIKLIS